MVCAYAWGSSAEWGLSVALRFASHRSGREGGIRGGSAQGRLRFRRRPGTSRGGRNGRLALCGRGGSVEGGRGRFDQSPSTRGPRPPPSLRCACCLLPLSARASGRALRPPSIVIGGSARCPGARSAPAPPAALSGRPISSARMPTACAHRGRRARRADLGLPSTHRARRLRSAERGTLVVPPGASAPLTAVPEGRQIRCLGSAELGSPKGRRIRRLRSADRSALVVPSGASAPLNSVPEARRIRRLGSAELGCPKGRRIRRLGSAEHGVRKVVRSGRGPARGRRWGARSSLRAPRRFAARPPPGRRAPRLGRRSIRPR